MGEHSVLTNSCIVTVPGFSMGHWTNIECATGCTVIICPKSTGGICICGGAPASRETALLEANCLRSQVDAILLVGGSVYGLSAVDGVYSYLVRHTRHDQKIPIVPTLAIFDLRVGQSGVFPTTKDAYEACCLAKQENGFNGSIGAGTGATVGKIRGIKWATKGGLGSASCSLGKGVTINALAIVNAFGDIIDPCTGKIIAGARDETGFINTTEYIKKKGLSYLKDRQNTTICVVTTNANLNKAEINKIAQMASAGIAKVVSPCWTEYDGDIVIALASGRIKCDYNLIGILSADLVAEAIVNAVISATSIAGIPSFSELLKIYKKQR